MPSAVCDSVGSQINFFMPRTPGVAAASSSPEPAEQAAAPKNATAKNGPQVLTFALQRRPRATRASSNKVRTGCVTCKRRHVKCDEAKPSCQRCVKWKGFCTGYETSSSDSPASTPTPDADYNCDAMTEGQTVGGDASEERPAEDVSLLLEPPTTTSSQDDTELQYFNHWLAHRTRLGGGLFDERLWDDTIPQLSRQHASVRYAVAAAGAIAKALNNSMRPTHPARMGANGPHYGAALSYYGRAIREVRSSRQMDTGSLRAAIVCCLLFVSFEVLHGDRRAAFSHINNGQRMMDELLRVCDGGGPAQQEEEGGRGNVIGAEAVEIDVLHVFQRLIQQSWSCGVLRRRRQQTSCGSDGDDARSADEPWCCRGGSGRKCVVDKMPPSFATLQEARRWWDVTQHFVIHSSDIVCRITHLGLGDDFLSECNERVRKHMDAVEKAGAGAKPSATTSEQWRDFKDVLDRWRGGFEPLWEAAAKSRHEDEKAYAQAALLRAHYLAMHGCVHAPLGCDYESVARLTPTYREVVELCGYLLTYQRRSFEGGYNNGEEVFTMDIGPTWPLLLAGTRCRDPGVRDEAIRLLRENPRRDGLWDSRMFYALTARNRVLEASNAQEGGLEEQWWRLQHRSAYVDEQGRLMARGLEKNTLTETWEFSEDDLSRFLFD